MHDDRTAPSQTLDSRNRPKGQDPIVIVGGGIGGLAAAALVAASGLEVLLLERADRLGGKLRTVETEAGPVDSGPTVFTLKRIFEEIFQSAGGDFGASVATRRATILARHAWSEGERLDLFADRQVSSEAIAAFAGPREAKGFDTFCAEARRTWTTLEQPFVRAPAPSISSLVAGCLRRTGLKGLGDLMAIRPFTSLWGALGDHFSDPRLRQLFGRYATYCGSSPFASPATLMLVAHVEQDGVWLVEGGMIALVEALASLAAARGARLRTGATVRAIETNRQGVSAVTLEGGERIAAKAVIFNGDVSALRSLGIGRGPAPVVARQRSLSALTLSLSGVTRGFPLHRHTVFFSRDYVREFDTILRERRLPEDPTVYVCAQDRGEEESGGDQGTERLFCLVNAPADGDQNGFSDREIEQCATRISQRLSGCGLSIDLAEAMQQGRATVTNPKDFARMFPATGGALYGRASHGWTASFKRAGVRTRIPGLYLAGGSIHPGPGIPMAALSGAMAAGCLLEALSPTSAPNSSAVSRKAAMPGGMSMR